MELRGQVLQGRASVRHCSGMPSRPPRWRRALRAGLRFVAVTLIVTVVLPAVAMLVAMGIVEGTTRDQIFERADLVPEMPVGIVFGAGLRPDGSPSPALARRVEAGVALYQAGKVSMLLMSGDSGTDWHDEVGPMRDLAIRSGVPARAIALDPAGYRTYESCDRARSVFGIERAVVVTQAFHLPRTVFTCERLGLTVVGYVAERFTGPTYTLAVLRERIAQLFSLFELTLGEQIRTSG